MSRSWTTWAGAFLVGLGPGGANTPSRRPEDCAACGTRRATPESTSRPRRTAAGPGSDAIAGGDRTTDAGPAGHRRWLPRPSPLPVVPRTLPPVDASPGAPALAGDGESGTVGAPPARSAVGHAQSLNTVTPAPLRLAAHSATGRRQHRRRATAPADAARSGARRRWPPPTPARRHPRSITTAPTIRSCSACSTTTPAAAPGGCGSPTPVMRIVRRQRDARRRRPADGGLRQRPDSSGSRAAWWIRNRTTSARPTGSKTCGRRRPGSRRSVYRPSSPRRHSAAGLIGSHVDLSRLSPHPVRP